MYLVVCQFAGVSSLFPPRGSWDPAQVPGSWAGAFPAEPSLAWEEDVKERVAECGVPAPVLVLRG